MPAVAITHSGARSGIRVTCGAMARHRASASSRLPVALYIRQIQPRAKYGSLSTSAATAASLSARPRPVCWATADVVTTRKNAASPIGSSSSATASSASRRASSHRPSSSRWEHSTRVRYARQDGRSNRRPAAGRLQLREEVDAVAEDRESVHPPPASPRGVLVGAGPPAQVDGLVGDREAFGQVVDRQAGGVPGLEPEERRLGVVTLGWQHQGFRRSERVGGRDQLGPHPGRPHGVALTEPGEGLDAELVDAARDADPGGLVRITVAASARAATSSVRRASSAACSPCREGVAHCPAPVEVARPLLEEVGRAGHGPTVGAGDACFPRCGRPFRAPSVAADQPHDQPRHRTATPTVTASDHRLRT